MTIFLALLHFSTSTVCSLNWCLQQMRAISPAHCSTLHQQHGQRCSVMTTSYILKQTIYLCIWLENIYFRNPIFRLTKCTFHKFGTSGELEKHDALCILPLNIFNEKIYIFLWFWMLALTSLTSVVVIYRWITSRSSKEEAKLNGKTLNLNFNEPPYQICRIK